MIKKPVNSEFIWKLNELELIWNYNPFKSHLKRNYLELIWNSNDWCKSAKTGETGKIGETCENGQTDETS